MATAHASGGLADTDILIDAARGLPRVRQFLASRQAVAPIQVSMISAMELVAGCRDKVQMQQVQQFLGSIHLLPVTESISQSAYRLMEAFNLSHGLMIPGALIAATALEYGLQLETKNIRHFQMIPSLVVERPH